MMGLPLEALTAGPMASAISNAVTRLLSEYTGRGPTKARTYINDDLITIVLQDTLTKGEQSLVRNDEAALVLANRKAYQRTMGPDLVASIEAICGRRVIAFLSDNHIDPDYAVESFVLAPPENGGADGQGVPTDGRQLERVDALADAGVLGQLDAAAAVTDRAALPDPDDSVADPDDPVDDPDVASAAR